MKSIALLGSVIACALAAGASPAAAQTCPHPGTVNGISVLIYCGSAKATTHVGAKTATWKGGQCKKLGTNFYVNFGDIVTQPVKKAPDSFQIIAGTSAKPATKDGSYTGTTVMMNKAGVSYIADALTLTLTHNTRAGTLTGTIEPSKGGAKVAFHATFSC
ncbi:MAG TPA: hypothetical protein VJQ85_03075 [Gaiellaceae bacterium]|nr:hypothetical protein [Gaiellaceae bacterium]